MAVTKEEQILQADAGWTLVTEVAGYVAVNKPVFFAYSDTEPTIKGEYTKDRRIENPDGAKLWLRPTGKNGSVAYVVVEW
jgi:hypothetical protein